MTDKKKTPDDKSLLLDYYHCTFFLPITGLRQDLHPENDPCLYSAGTRDEDTAQAWLYFSATHRDILFQKELEPGEHPRPIQEWRLPEDEAEKLELHLGKAACSPEKAKTPAEKAAHALSYQTARIISVRLYRYFNGIYLLAFTVRPEKLESLRNEQEKRYEKCLEGLKQRYRQQGWDATGEDLEALEKLVRERLTEANQGVPLFRDECPATLEAARKKYSDEAEGYEQLQLGGWLRFTRLARQLYPSFAEQGEEGKISPLCLYRKEKDGKLSLLAKDFEQKLEPEIPLDAGVNWSKPAQVLLRQFFPGKERELEKNLRDKVQFDDDRMFVSVAYGLVDKKQSLADRERLFSLMLYVDRLDDAWLPGGWAYSEKFVKQQMQDQVLRRWADSGLLFGYTDYSNAAASSGRFFRDIVAPRHILPIYDRMLVQALFYRESLRKYDTQICVQTSTIVDKDKLDHMQARRQEFIRFTNQYWFHNLSEQVQGKEIFRLQQQALGLKEHYDIIKDELERTDEFLQVRHEIKLGRWGWRVALLALYYTVIPIVNDMMKSGGENAASLWSKAGGCLGLGEWAGLVLLLMPPLIVLSKFSWIRKVLKR